jgi:hypothetical protein
MSGLIGGGNVSKAAPEASSIRVVTSSYGRPIPLAWGKVRLAPFLLWYNDFKAIATEQDVGGKGGTSGTSVNYTYQAALMLGMCEGPVNSVPRVWKGKEDNKLATTAAQTYSKLETAFAPVGGGAVTLAAPGTILSVVEAYAGWGSGDSGTFYALTSPTDYTRSGNVITFNTGSFSGQPVTFQYTYTKTAASDSPLGDLGLTLAKGTFTQAAWTHLSANWPADAITYPGIAYVASPTFNLGSSSDVPNIGLEVETSHAFSQTIPDVNPRDFIVDYLTNPYYGAYFPADKLGDLSSYSNYCIASGLFLSPDYNEQSPAFEVLERIASITNSDWTQVDGRFTIVPYADQAVTGNGVTWTPSLTAVYEIGPDDFVDKGSGGPIRIKRKDPATRYNSIHVKFKDRDRQYNDNVVEGRDSAEIGKNGLRPAPQNIESPEIKSQAVADVVANLAVQRSVNVCNTYEFTLKQNKAVLAPLDLLALTHPSYPGLSQRLIRILQIDDDVATGDLSVIAEEVPVGTASAITYPIQQPSGYAVNYNVDPGNVATPRIFELPVSMALETGLELAVAVRGLGSDWGGCEVWSSVDGTQYRQVGTVYAPARYGTISSVVSFTSVSTSASVTGLGAEQLGSGTATEALDLLTLCFVGGANPEYFAYQTATLTAAGAYTLTGLVRGAKDTPARAHTTGDAFVRVDDRVVRGGALPLAMIGQTVSFKFCSFNKFGGGKQTLAGVSAYTYTITGAMAQLRPVDVTGLAATGTAGSARVSWTPNTEGDYSETELRLGASWAAGTLLARIKGSSYPWNIVAAGTYTVWAKHRDVLGNESATASSVGITVDALGTVVASYQGFGQNLLPESDQAVMPKFAVSYVVNGANLSQGVQYPAFFGLPTYQLTGGRSRLVCLREIGIHAGPTTNPQHDGAGRTISGAADFIYRVDVEPGARIGYSVYGNGHRCRWQAWLTFLDASGAAVAGGGLGNMVAENGTLPNVLENLDRSEVFATVPAGAALARVWVIKYNTISGADSYVFFGLPQQEVVAPNTLTSSPYSAGPVGAIGTSQLVLNTATDIAEVDVGYDDYTFPNPTGVQDRTFTALTYANASVDPIEVEVTSTGGRRVITPSGLAGTTDVTSWVAVLNTTDSLNVSTTQDWMAPHIEDLPASQTTHYTEATSFNVVIPPGKTFQFTSLTRVIPVVGSTGNIRLVTSAYTLKIAAVKR